jgi:hypothetical protein
MPTNAGSSKCAGVSIAVVSIDQSSHQFWRHGADGHDAAFDWSRVRLQTGGGDFEMFIYERIRNEQGPSAYRYMFGTNQPKLQEINALMEANLEEPIDLDQLALYVDVSLSTAGAAVPEVSALLTIALLPQVALDPSASLLKQTCHRLSRWSCGFVSTPHI